MTNIVRLDYYIPQRKDIVSVSSGLRPYRQGGIRMEKQVLHGKVFYHHYGHGGGGLSLAYGCVKHILDTLVTDLKKDEPIGVLGAGIVGLTTAYQLIQKGHKVTIYADIVPFDKNKHKPEITTTVAAGYWMPLKVGNKEQTRKYAVDTWDHYTDVRKKQLESGRPLGIQLLQVYSINDQQQLTYMEIDGVIEPKDCQVDFGDGKLLAAKTFLTYIIESQKYLPWLIQSMQSTGLLTFVEHSFSNMDQIIKLPEQHLFNCLGLNTCRLFPSEQSMMPIKGHVIKFWAQKEVMNYVLFMKVKDGYILQVPHRQSNKLCLGITYQNHKDNPFPQEKMVNKVFNTSKQYFESIKSSISLRPRL